MKFTALFRSDTVGVRRTNRWLALSSDWCGSAVCSCNVSRVRGTIQCHVAYCTLPRTPHRVACVAIWPIVCVLVSFVSNRGLQHICGGGPRRRRWLPSWILAARSLRSLSASSTRPRLHGANLNNVPSLRINGEGHIPLGISRARIVICIP